MQPKNRDLRNPYIADIYCELELNKDNLYV
jgi:hypothetical protein